MLSTVNAEAEPVTGLDVGAECVLHLNHARDKHPWPAGAVKMTVVKVPDDLRTVLGQCRMQIALESEAYGYQTPFSVLQCEVAEFLEAVIRGDRNDAFHELMDAVAVGLRILNGDAGNCWKRTAIRFPNREPRPRFPDDDE